MRDLLNGIRTAFYRIRYQSLFGRARFGSRTRISCRLEIKGPGHVSIGRDVQIESGPWPEEFVTIFTHSPTAQVVIGDGVHLRGTRIGCRERISLGNRTIVDAASLYDTDFHSPVEGERNSPELARTKAIEIGADVHIGSDCLCGKGSRIGDAARLLPGTVIGTRSVLPGAVLTGNPARTVSPNTE